MTAHYGKALPLPAGWRLLRRREIIPGGQYVRLVMSDGLLPWPRYLRPQSLRAAIAAAERGDWPAQGAPVTRTTPEEQHHG